MRARIDPRKTDISITNKIPGKVEETTATMVAKEQTSLELGGGQAISAMTEFLNLLDEGEAAGWLDPNESLIQTFAKDAWAKVNANDPRAKLWRSRYDTLLSTLSRVKGNANQKEFGISAIVFPHIRFIEFGSCVTRNLHNL